jgi:hypothetical protein
MENPIRSTSPYNNQVTPQGLQFVFFCGYCGVSQPAISIPVPPGIDPDTPAGKDYRDGALVSAFAQVELTFIYCKECNTWVCKKCWNGEAVRCMGCAPVPGVSRGRMGPPDISMSPSMFTLTQMLGTPPSGAAIELSGDACKQCGNPLVTGAKYCSQCGSKSD